MKWKIMMTGVLLAVLTTGSAFAALSENKVKEVLDFTKEFIMEESKNSGIFKLERPGGTEVQWFELYGILDEIQKIQDKYVVTVDVDLFGYSDRNYLLYFIVKEQGEGQYTLDEMRIGPRFTRAGSDKMSIPE